MEFCQGWSLESRALKRANWMCRLLDVVYCIRKNTSTGWWHFHCRHAAHTERGQGCGIAQARLGLLGSLSER